MSKPILLVMNNPLSVHPRFAVYPHPVGCTGYRIWQMLLEVDSSITRSRYLTMFDRRNLVTGPWNQGLARKKASLLHSELALRRSACVIVLGDKVWRAMSLDPDVGLLEEDIQMYA